MSEIVVPFNKPYMTGQELEYIGNAHKNGVLAGDGPFTKLCHGWLEAHVGTKRSLLAHSCTAALEMSAMLLEIKAGDEIIMPSYTFVSTANAFAIRGGVPVFVDIRPDTLNIDETLIEGAITTKTRAILPVHYAGVGCEMDTIMSIARANGLAVVEDAAQGVLSSYKGRALGSIGDLGTYSFHETKNVISGEGGALLVNRPDMAARAEIIREKGTDRSRFFRGEVDKYTWQDLGSSFLPGELIAAFLWAQLEKAREITDDRLSSWNYYHEALADAEDQGLLCRPIIPTDCGHNAHMYYVLLPQGISRDNLISRLAAKGVNTVFHYVPLHSSPAGSRLGRQGSVLSVTDDLSARLLRLPMWVGLGEENQDIVISALLACLKSKWTKE